LEPAALRRVPHEVAGVVCLGDRGHSRRDLRRVRGCWEYFL